VADDVAIGLLATRLDQPVALDANRGPSNTISEASTWAFSSTSGFSALGAFLALGFRAFALAGLATFFFLVSGLGVLVFLALTASAALGLAAFAAFFFWGHFLCLSS